MKKNNLFFSATLVFSFMFFAQNTFAQITKVCGNATFTYVPTAFNTDFSTNSQCGNCLPSSETCLSVYGNQANLISPAVGTWSIDFALPVTSYELFGASFDAGNGETWELSTMTLNGVSVGSASMVPSSANTGSICLSSIGTNIIGSTVTGAAGFVEISAPTQFDRVVVIQTSSNAQGNYTPIPCEFNSVSNPACSAGGDAPIFQGN